MSSHFCVNIMNADYNNVIAFVRKYKSYSFYVISFFWVNVDNIIKYIT